MAGDTRGAAFSMEEKWAWVDGRPGAASVQVVTDAMASIDSAGNTVRDRVLRGSDELGVDWQGAAATRAQERLQGMGAGMQDTSGVTGNGAGRLDDYGRSWQQMKSEFQFDDPARAGWDRVWRSSFWQAAVGVADSRLSFAEQNQINSEAADAALQRHYQRTEDAYREFRGGEGERGSTGPQPTDPGGRAPGSGGAPGVPGGSVPQVPGRPDAGVDGPAAAPGSESGRLAPGGPSAPGPGGSPGGGPGAPGAADPPAAGGGAPPPGPGGGSPIGPGAAAPGDGAGTGATPRPLREDPLFVEQAESAPSPAPPQQSMPPSRVDAPMVDRNAAFEQNQLARQIPPPSSPGPGVGLPGGGWAGSGTRGGWSGAGAGPVRGPACSVLARPRERPGSRRRARPAVPAEGVRPSPVVRRPSAAQVATPLWVLSAVRAADPGPSTATATSCPPTRCSPSIST
ncbi:hypothetical protein [Pseudonocardia sp. HH130630-07]|uniref:hypothetical protein n=1 Tax=Pseudonocardia sp. HH130630-07 TaxID=1690815 RepID=UPI000814DCBF|nr:hypothetical protein [Pseudonocardia sp. HH130630-07]ANY06103.1 hypothetical protein AFB00_07095 [Pseudonocardia sp. HH130630-07]